MINRVSIVVLTHNRKHELLRTLDKLHELEAPYAIHVVDNASTDGSADAAIARYPDCRMIRLRHNIGAAGRNAGAIAAQTPYVAFCDDDTWWAPGALARASSVMDSFPRLAALTACVLVGSDARIDPACARMARSPLPNELGVPGTAVLGCLAGACIMRRNAFTEVGGYQPRFFLGKEEALLALDLMAAGWHMAYVPSVIVHHHPSMARDTTARRRLLLRNSLWCAWLRRPWKSAAHETARLMRTAMLDPSRMRGAAEALSAVPWVLRNRRVIPSRVEHALQLVQHD